MAVACGESRVGHVDALTLCSDARWPHNCETSWPRREVGVKPRAVHQYKVSPFKSVQNEFVVMRICFLTGLSQVKAVFLYQN